MKIKIPNSVGWEDISEQEACVVVNVQTGVFFKLTGVEARIWNYMVEDYTLQQIPKELAEFYQVEESTVNRDLTEFVAGLESNGLIEKVT